MLYSLGFPEIQILLATWLSLMLYSAWLSMQIPKNVLVKILSISAVFVVAYVTVVGSYVMLGKPNFNDDEQIGQLGGFVQFETDGKQLVAVLIKTANGPSMFAVPYVPNEYKALQDSLNKYIKTGQPQLLRRRPDRSTQSNGSNEDGDDGGYLQFYEFNQNLLVPKDRSVPAPEN
jgi:hypothetical protein